MALKSLHFNIFKLVGGLLCFSSLSILLAVWIATTNHARTQVDEDLQVGERIFKQVLASRELRLFNSADVLTSDFGFKQAIATEDKATIESVLENHGERISADLMVLVSLSGDVISAQNEPMNQQVTTQIRRLAQRAQERGGDSGLVQFGDALYQVMLLTVEAPAPIAVALVGFEMDKAFVNELKEITSLEISVQTGSGSSDILLSSLPAQQVNQAIEQNAGQIDLFRTPFTYQDMYISKRFLLSNNGSQEIWIVLSEDLKSIFSEFDFLQFRIFAIAVLSLILALVLGILFAKNLTLPLTQLAKMAQRIAKGDYYNGVDTKANSQEIRNLALAFGSMQQNIKERELEIQYQADHDLLTGLYNRYQLARIIRKKLDQKETFQAVALKILDFRGINDTFGYQNGDACLNLFSDRVLTLGGIAARLNGGEVLWIPDQDVNEKDLEKIRSELENAYQLDNLALNLKLAVAVVHLPEDADTEGSLFRRLNITLETAQQQSNLFQAYRAELEDAYLKKLSILSELKQLLSSGSKQTELSMFYQPKLNVKTGCIEKAEALIRWNSQKLGFVSPELFIPIAEHAGIIEQLTDWIVRRVIEDISQWQQLDINLQVAINLSVQDVANDKLLPKVIQFLEEKQVNKHALSFELTESDLMKDPVKAVSQLNSFRSYGFGLAIDDFGTGYSSLAYLKDMPVTELKLDKSFILNLARSEADQNIVQSVIALAKSFNLDIVAEGVEDADSLTLLSNWGCDWIQGYYVAKPMSADGLVTWLQVNKQWGNK